MTNALLSPITGEEPLIDQGLEGDTDFIDYLSGRPLDFPDPPSEASGK